MIETIRKRFDPPFGTRGKIKGGKAEKEEGKEAVTSAAGSLTAAAAADGQPIATSLNATGTDIDGGTGGTVGKRTRRRAH